MFTQDWVPENFEDTQDYVNNSIQYLKTLTDAAGKKIIDGPWKTFIIGFGTSAQSSIAIAERLMHRNNSAFENCFNIQIFARPFGHRGVASGHAGRAEHD